MFWFSSIAGNFVTFFETGFRLIQSTRDTEHKVTYSSIKTSMADQIQRLQRMKFFIPERGQALWEADSKKLNEDVLKGFSDLEL